jgi:hypothetical protein
VGEDYCTRLRAAADVVGALTTLARAATAIDGRPVTITTDSEFIANCAFPELDRLGLGIAQGQSLTIRPGCVVPLGSEASGVGDV